MKNNIDVLEQSESDRINEKLNQLLDSHGWSCSLLDMVSDCQAAAESNYEKLLDAVREGKKILVDGKYYISIPTTIKATEKEISYCNILGQSDNAEFVFTSDGTMFTVQKAKEILVDGIALTATAENITMFWLNSTGHIDNFTFSNTTCTRKIRCLETSGTSSDPSGIGIKNIRINKNQLLNQDLDFLKFINMPFEVCEISENKIRNFTSAKCFDLHISNTNTYYKEIRARRTKTICRDNELINDDSCYLTNSSFNYYTLILLEGKQCHYTGNHVEGLKSNHNVNLYDAYLTADEVIYEGNTNKNNMCFSSLKGLNCELVKAKDGHVRYIKNNRFIVEKSWLDRLNKEPNHVYYVYLYEAEKLSDWYFENNFYDVYDLRHSASSQRTRNFIFKNNTLTGALMSGILCHTRFLDGVDYRDAFIDISHNSFTRKGNDSDVYSVNLLRERIPSNPEENLEFGFRSSVNVSNNHLVVTSGNINQSYRAKEVAVTNNTVLGKSNMVIDIDTFALDSSSVTISNCIYRSDGTITDKRSPIGIGSKNINYKIIGKAIESGTVKRTFHNVFGAYYPEVRSKKIIVEYKVKNTLGIYHFHMNFEYGYDPVENRMFVRFTNDSNEAKEFRYSPPSNPSNEPTTDVMPIKLIPLSGSVPPFSIVMRNTQNLGIYTEYRGTGLPQEEVQEIECWIRTIPI